MIKSIRTIMKQDKERYKVPRKVQDVIPIRRIWPDGIFQVGSKFTKMYRFTDINYLVASREDKESMFLTYSELLNSLDSGATTKLMIYNHRQNRASFEKSILMPMKEDGLDQYRKEYNQMLLDKATGANGIMQEKYLTVSVARKDVEEARTYFSRIGADLSAHFAALGSKCMELTAAERLRMLHDFYRAGEETTFDFDIKSMARKGHDIRDFICPDSIEKNKDHLILGDQYCRVLFLKDYASYIKDSMVTELTDLNRNMMLSIDILPIPTDEAVHEVESRLLGVETNITNWQRRQNANNNFSAVVPYDMELQRKESKEFLDDLTTRDQRMMFAVLTMVLTADTKEQLDADTETVQAIARKHSYSERLYCGNAIEQSGELYLDGTQMNVSGDIRVGCTTNFRTGAIETNRYVTLVGASDSMQNYELTSYDDESLDGRVVVAPGTITYGTETYSVADAEPYLSHFTHNHKEIVTNTEYEAETGTSSQPKSLVLYGAIQKYSVTYTDGIGGASFADEVTRDLRRGTPTPAFTGGTPTRSGYTFTGWEPSVAATVTDNAVYTAQWAKNRSSSHHSTRYTLHYESNGGTAYKDERYSSGTKVTLDKTPTRESYTFTGWYADKALTQKITSVTMNSDKTVYAGWEATGVPDKLNGDDHFAYVIGYPDGKVHPKGNISRAETATIFFRLLKADIRDGNLTADNGFSDVSNGQWHNKAVSTMAKLGIVKGRRADRFDPDASITRAEFAAICARFNTKPVENSGSFSDISGHWAENEIERAAAFGWISGYPDGTFRPDARITRAEAMTMINRVLCRMPQSESDLLDSMVTWPDNKPSDWHYLAVQEATNSHDFDRQGEVGESWPKLTSVPDWKRYQ